MALEDEKPAPPTQCIVPTTLKMDIYFRAEISYNQNGIESFTPKFMEEFRASFYQFDTIEEHLGHLAWCATARGMSDTDFIEGYMVPKDMGITWPEPKHLDTDIVK